MKKYDFYCLWTIKIDILGESNKQDIQHTVSKGIGSNYLYFTKSPSAYGIPISRAGM